MDLLEIGLKLCTDCGHINPPMVAEMHGESCLFRPVLELTAQRDALAEAAQTAVDFIAKHKAALIGVECTWQEYEAAMKPVCMALALVDTVKEAT